MRRRRDPLAGVTLVEVLVALSIVAVMASASVLVLRGDPRASAETEARKLVIRLANAVDETLSTGTSLHLETEADGYRFTDPARQVDAVFAAHTLPHGVVLDEDEVIHVIEADGFTAPFDLVLRDGETPWRVRFDGLGAVAEAG